MISPMASVVHFASESRPTAFINIPLRCYADPLTHLLPASTPLPLRIFFPPSVPSPFAPLEIPPHPLPPGYTFGFMSCP